MDSFRRTATPSKACVGTAALALEVDTTPDPRRLICTMCCGACVDSGLWCGPCAVRAQPHSRAWDPTVIPQFVKIKTIDLPCSTYGRYRL